MVNERFPSAASHGFEMVDSSCRPPPRSPQFVNRLFTANQIVRIFSKFSDIRRHRRNVGFNDAC
jgi:hypothetical protein